jgi:hypothetical protein
MPDDELLLENKLNINHRTSIIKDELEYLYKYQEKYINKIEKRKNQ